MKILIKMSSLFKTLLWLNVRSARGILSKAFSTRSTTKTTSVERFSSTALQSLTLSPSGSQPSMTGTRSSHRPKPRSYSCSETNSMPTGSKSASSLKNTQICTNYRTRTNILTNYKALSFSIQRIQTSLCNLSRRKTIVLRTTVCLWQTSAWLRLLEATVM